MKLSATLLLTGFAIGLIIGRHIAPPEEKAVFVEYRTPVELPLPKTAHAKKQVELLAAAIPASALRKK